MNPDTRNLIAAICLSMSVLIGYQILFGEESNKNNIKNEQQNVEKNNEPSISLPKGKENTFLTEKTKKVKNIKRINIINDEIEGSISLLGARLDDLTLKNYRKTIDPESDKIKFLRKIDEINPYFIQFGWSSPNNQKVPNGNTIWNSSNTILDPKSPIVLTWNNGEGLEFLQEISIDKNFMIKVVQKVKNDTSNPVNLYPYGLIRRAGEPETTDFFVLHEGPLGVFDGSLKEHSYSDLKESGQKGMSFNTNEKGGWIGITDKYWMAALIPDQKTNSNFTFRYVNNSVSYQTDYLGSLSKIPANSEVKIESRVFSGAKRLDLLDKYEEDLKIKNFDLAIDFGWFYFLTKPFFYALSWANNILGNFGLAILAITVIVKIVFFPLANKSYKSMARMRVLTPQLQKLRERFGNDRQKMNMEMMALYKREKVNPAAGCLPILVQIPVFFALYKVLFVSIEMRQAPFFGWIKDLSALDPTSIFNIFGLLPYSTDFLPDFLNLGIWPLLMGTTMVLQQRLNPKPPDPVQAQIFAWMPVVFTFLLATFPAGLVIYWTWNNLLSITQQWIITRKINKEKS
ncbi:MAG: membrane protein insertase YidC [SAR116 cluster bacterium]|nr:membrane protein insertase YidC [SAR116 cluster bacterium]RPH09920.1 MAG: membrane protein insertase YidC [Alphaproteobacteria bacterium TMED54]